MTHVMNWSLAAVEQLRGGNNEPVGRVLRRIHMHFLAYHVLCQRGSGASAHPEQFEWDMERAGAAVVSGSLACTSNVRVRDQRHMIEREEKRRERRKTRYDLVSLMQC